MFDWNWSFAWEILPDLLRGLRNTLIAAGVGFGAAIPGGLLLALAQRTPFRPLTLAVREVVEFIRSTPLVLQIFFVFYVGPQYGMTLAPWLAGLLAISIHYSAYLSEVYRGGIESVPRGQWEACRALNLSTRDTYLRIVLPQALPPSLAGMGNYLIAIFKDTPMLSVIGVGELLHAANSVGAEYYRFLEPYTLVGVIFLMVSLPAAFFIRILERWVRRKLGMS